MNDQTLIQLACQILNQDELEVWLTKRVSGKGRRAGSLALHITEETFRYRLASAERKIRQHLEAQEAA